MSDDEMTEILGRLRAGGELSVRNQDGEWGIRGTSHGFETWARVPYEPPAAPSAMTEAEIRAAIGRWEFASTCARLKVPNG